MTMDWLAIFALAGLLLTGLAAIGNRVLLEFSRHELEVYCRRRRRRELFGEILARHDRVALAAESLQSLGTAVFLLAGTLWWLPVETPAVTPIRLAIALAIAAILLLTATSWIPWAVAQVWSAPFLFHTWRWWSISSYLLLPLTSGGNLAEAVARRLAGRPDDEAGDEEAFEDEIRTIVTAGLREGLLEADASEMIEGIIELGDADVSDIMTPRSEVDAIDVELSWRDMLRFVIQVGRTRLPVFENNLDHVIGILYVKDLLQELSHPDVTPRTPLRNLIREPWFVPTTKPLDDLLQEFLRTRNHMAIVVDEYGSMAGVVTIEDVLEEIVGEIMDESDKEAEQEVRSVNEHVAEALGRTHLYDLNQQLGLDFPEPDEYDTIGGFVVTHFGQIPKAGDSFVSDGVRITVLDASRRRVERVRLEMLEDQDGAVPREANGQPSQ